MKIDESPAMDQISSRMCNRALEKRGNLLPARHFYHFLTPCGKEKYWLDNMVKIELDIRA